MTSTYHELLPSVPLKRLPKTKNRDAQRRSVVYHSETLHDLRHVMFLVIYNIHISWVLRPRSLNHLLCFLFCSIWGKNSWLSIQLLPLDSAKMSFQEYQYTRFCMEFCSHHHHPSSVNEVFYTLLCAISDAQIREER